MGDVLEAMVLAPQNGQDLIQILGRQVAAQLPPGIHPGEVLLLQVTGFSNTQIFVQNLGPYDGQNPPAALLPDPSASVVLTAATQNDAPAAPSPPSPPVPPARTPAAPPPSVFVAASVRPAPAAQGNGGAAEAVNSAVQRAAAIANSVEARIAAAQTAKPPQTVQPQVFTLRPAMTGAAPPVRPSPVQAAVQNAVQNAAGTAQRVIQTAADLIKTLRLPDTPLVRTASAIAPQAAGRLPAVLARLEAALPRESADPRVSTLRIIAAFVARIAPQNEETLAAQISAYVSNAVEGAESKLVQLLQAAGSAAAGQSPDFGGKAAAREQTPVSGPAQHPDARSAPIVQSASQGRALERAAAIDHDLKSLVLSLLRDPPAERGTTLTQALNETLITLTGTQLNTLSNSLNDARAVTIALPVFYREGGKPAQIRISRDGDGTAAKLDADNFHIAFVLDTANLGTVAIDLQTAGRAVKVDVKTEQSRAASRFSDTLSALRSRLEDLRYRVLSAGASVAERRTAQVPARTEQRPGRSSSGVDMRA